MRVSDAVTTVSAVRQWEWVTQQQGCDEAVADSLCPIPAVGDLFYAPEEFCARYRHGEVVSLAPNRVGPLWAVVVFYVGSLHDIKDVCFSLHISPGLGSRVWSFVDEARPNRWMAVGLLGVLDGTRLTETVVTVDQFLHVCGGLHPLVSVAVESVQLIPWYDYRRWRKQCDWALEASLWVWSGGEDIDMVETTLHFKLHKLTSDAVVR